MLFQVSYERFVKEINNETLTEAGKDKLECEDLGDSFSYYLTSMDRPKAYVFNILKTEMTEGQRMYLAPLSRLAVRITDQASMQNIAKILMRIEEQLSPNNRVETQSIDI